MKASFILLAMLLLAASCLKAQSGLALLQYYWDDADWSAAHEENLSGLTQIEVNLQANLGNLQPGLHALHLRIRSADGISSIPITKFYYFMGNGEPFPIVAAEYFIDSDPGPGSGNALPLNAGVMIDQLFPINLGSVPWGAHSIGYRVQNGSGVWSLPMWKQFFKFETSDTAPVTSLSWFFTGSDAPAEIYSLPLPGGPTLHWQGSLDLPTAQLTDGQSYMLHVFACNANGHKSHPVVIPISPIMIPRNIHISVSEGSIVLSWDSVLGADSYTIQAASDPYGPFLPVGNTPDPTWIHALESKEFFRISASD